MMKYVEVENWARKQSYEHFKDYDQPFFSITANLDATELYRFCKENNLSFSIATLFCSIKAANEIREFRIRLINEKPVEFDEIHATQTILNDDETFSFCYFENKQNIFDYDKSGKIAVAKYKELKTLDVENERIDLVYYSVIPWISFTSFKNAMKSDKFQTVPRIVFGKMFEENGKKLLPHSVEVHHAVMDGIHVGKYFEKIQQRFVEPT